MPTTALGLVYPSVTTTVNPPQHIQDLAVSADAVMPVLVKSWKTTPNILGFTAEADVLSNTWTPPKVGCYRIVATVPFDQPAVSTVKARIRVAGNELDFDMRDGPLGAFVGKLRVDQTIDIVSLTPVVVKTTIERVAGAATCNCRALEARTEIFLCGPTGVRA